MEQFKKIIPLFIGFFLIGISGALAIDYSAPKDLYTIETLIELHKMMKSNEQASLEQITIVTGEQEIATQQTKGFSDVVTTIHQKMSDANSYIVMTTSIANIATKLSDLAKEFADFEEAMPKIIIKKPFTAQVYYDTHKKVANTVKRLYENILVFTAGGEVLNVLKASIDEKFKLLYIIDSTVTQLRGTIRNATSYIKYTNKGSYNLMGTKDLLPDSYKKQAIEKLTNQWNNAKGL